MSSKTKLLLVGWSLALAGLAIVVWQTTSTAGGGSDRIFNVGVAALIVGNVLRVYARYRPSQPKPVAPKTGDKARSP